MLAIVLIALLTPVLVCLSLAVLLSSGWPILFAQVRVGRDGRPFHIYKFRTMVRDAPMRLHVDRDLRERHRSGGFKLPLDEDPRVTWFGRWLRMTSLDELPQLFNVLSGAMTLVGPRPVVAEELDLLYGTRTAEYLLVQPGMTGPWQVMRATRRDVVPRHELEAGYLTGWSFTGDLLTLSRTPAAVLRGSRRRQ